MGASDPIKFTCAICGQEHDLTHLSLGAAQPATWRLLTEEERRSSLLSNDQCMIVARGETSYYIRGCLDVQIRGSDKSFTWGVWCSLSEKSFDEISEHWDDPLRSKIGPHFGWLCTPIPTYPDTMYLKTHVRQRDPGLRPLVELEPTDYPLAIHQRDGIESNELKRIVVQVLHPHSA